MHDDRLAVDATTVAGHDVLVVTGELDLVAAPALQAAVDCVFERGESSLVLDLNGVRFIDSAGLRVLVSAHRTLKDQRGRLRIVCSESRVRQVFRLANLDDVFAVYDTVDQALAEETA